VRIPPEPLEPRAWRSPLGWAVISIGNVLVLLGVARQELEPALAGILLVVLALLSHYWLPGVFLNWVVRNRRPPHR
jgi:hypothetical protein